MYAKDSQEMGEFPIFLDSETCGLHSMPVLFQWATDGDIELFDAWHKTIRENLEFVEFVINHKAGVVFFNAVFDMFHLVKWYNCLKLAVERGADLDEPPVIEEIAAVEKDARDGVVLKPQKVLDLFLHARKGPYQATMDRKDITIRRVPAQLAPLLANELERRIPINPLYFARRSNEHAPQWSLQQSKDYETRKDIKGFYDVSLKFAPSSALKALAVDALKIPQSEVLKHSDVEVSKKLRPRERGWAPFHEAETKAWGRWPDVIKYHISHWRFNKLARRYAKDDIVYTRGLWEHFGRPPMDDDDSILAVSVANVRWKGYKVDLEKLKELHRVAQENTKVGPRDPAKVMAWISAVLDETELAVFHNTKAITLEAIEKWTVTCEKCFGECDGENPCDRCDNNGEYAHPASERAKLVLKARGAKKEVELYEKILEAGRFHPSYKVIGALSGRMSGADGLNPQGIKRDKKVRSAFDMAFDGEFLGSGDFDAFEVVLAAAEYNDPQLIEDLRSGKKIHAIAALDIFGGDYDEIVASKGTEEDLYTKGKTFVFQMIYGGDEGTAERKLGLTPEDALAGCERFGKRYPVMEKSRDAVFKMFCPMRQPVPGGRIIWGEPARYIESMFGFRRYFDLENQLCKALFDLAENPPKEWDSMKFKVRRRADKIQTALGAARSALYGAAFAVQGANMRAAANHRIQSAGAQVTKRVQVAVWSLQPKGIHPWVVRPMNVHDEVNNVSDSLETAKNVKVVVDEVVESYREKVPLIAMTWEVTKKSWGD